jgi:transposase
VRVADFVEAGHSCRAAAEHFDVSESFAIKLVRRTRDTGSPHQPGKAACPDAASWSL